MSELSYSLEVENLSVSFGEGQDQVLAVNGVSFHARPGEIVGIVGESGSGKSLSIFSVLNLLPPNAFADSEKLKACNVSLPELPDEEMRALRGSKIAMIFQEPMSALNPVRTIGSQLCEVIQRHTPQSSNEAMKLAESLLNDVQIRDSKRVLSAFPHELSGGMRQRVLIAMAFSSARNASRQIISDSLTGSTGVSFS